MLMAHHVMKFIIWPIANLLNSQVTLSKPSAHVWAVNQHHSPMCNRVGQQHKQTTSARRLTKTSFSGVFAPPIAHGRLTVPFADPFDSSICRTTSSRSSHALKSSSRSHHRGPRRDGGSRGRDRHCGHVEVGGAGPVDHFYRRAVTSRSGLRKRRQR